MESSQEEFILTTLTKVLKETNDNEVPLLSELAPILETGFTQGLAMKQIGSSINRSLATFSRTECRGLYDFGWRRPEMGN